ncbi:MAG: hypothetical protein AAFR18_20730 [Cyanobacteria bacterium J06627_32]
MSRTQKPYPVLNLSELRRGLPAITPSFGAALAEACAICLTEQRHQPVIELEIEGDFEGRFALLYPTVTDQMRRCWNDREYATEQAAYGIALSFIQQLTEYDDLAPAHIRLNRKLAILVGLA